MRIIQTAAQASIIALITFGIFTLPLGITGLSGFGRSVPTIPESSLASQLSHPVSMTIAAEDSAETLADAAPEALEAADEVAQPEQAGLQGAPVHQQRIKSAKLRRPQLKRGLSRKALKTSKAGTKQRKVKKKTKKKKKNRCEETPNPGIEKLGAASYAVERAMLDTYASDIPALMDLVTVYWHRNEAGKVDGFRVKGIQCGTLLHQAGLRNGDVIREVHGRPVTNLLQAVRAYRKLRRNNVIELEVERRGAPVLMKYRMT